MNNSVKMIGNAMLVPFSTVALRVRLRDSIKTLSKHQQQ